MTFKDSLEKVLEDMIEDLVTNEKYRVEKGTTLEIKFSIPVAQALASILALIEKEIMSERDLKGMLLANHQWFFDYQEGKMSVGRIRELIADACLSEMRKKINAD
jgi:hypothetical protein